MLFGTSSADVHFFTDFVRHGQQVVAAARLVQRILEAPNESAQLAREVTAAEHRGDEITREIVRHLHETWLTPFDRPDAFALISALDDVLDSAEAVSEKVILFSIDRPRPDAIEIADLLVYSTDKVLRALELLPAASKQSGNELLELCVAIRTLEEAADAVHGRALAALFKAEPPMDPLEILKWREIYDTLESATDRCEDVADLIEGIVLESR